MSEVQPIRNKKELKLFTNSMKARGDKYYIMWLIGTHTGLRISDILKLKVSNVENLTSRKVKEQKTNKGRFLYMGEQCERIVRQYIKDNNLKSEDYLVCSRKHDENGNKKPISTIQAYRIIKEVAEECSIDSVGTHTMRKTFGYHYYKKTHDVATLMKIFNHSSQTITLDYIGISDDMIRDSLDDFFLF